MLFVYSSVQKATNVVYDLRVAFEHLWRVGNRSKVLSACMYYRKHCKDICASSKEVWMQTDTWLTLPADRFSVFVQITTSDRINTITGNTCITDEIHENSLVQNSSPLVRLDMPCLSWIAFIFDTNCTGKNMGEEFDHNRKGYTWLTSLAVPRPLVSAARWAIRRTSLVCYHEEGKTM